MHYVKLTMPRAFTYNDLQWQSLKDGLQRLLLTSPLTYTVEVNPDQGGQADSSLLFRSLDQPEDAVVATRTNLGFLLEFRAESEAATDDLLGYALLCAHCSGGRVKVSSTLHRQRSRWEAAERRLLGVLDLPPGTFTRPTIHPLKPATLGLPLGTG